MPGTSMKGWHGRKHNLCNLWDVPQFISLYRQEGNPREQPLENNEEYTEH